MARLGLCALLLLGCGGSALAPDAPNDARTGPSSHDASDAAATSDKASAACPLPTEPNTLAVVESALAAPPWVEIEVSVAFPDPPFDWAAYGSSAGTARDQLMAQRVADLAPVGDALAARLRAIGGRELNQFWLIADVSAVVPAGGVPQIPCWPNVTTIDGDAPSSDGDPPNVSCFTGATCASTCAQLSGDRLDLAHGCAHHDVPVTCAQQPTSAGDQLSCYVDLATGQAFAVAAPWLVELGDAAVRKCTPAEGGSTSPGLLPECP
ncbi:MAG TPA: hypothetical protein VH560_01020 [Polyangia bacterium]|jgi:hypothetical protein|nr:hypothetical protein [Polyangia bacterium]